MAENKKLLQIKQLMKAFGGLKAINKVTFDIGIRELTCIIGPNGAGKSTLFNLITGRLVPDSGIIFFEGEDITGLRPDQMCKKGIGRSFQRTSVFAKLSVFETIFPGQAQEKAIQLLRFYSKNEEIWNQICQEHSKPELQLQAIINHFSAEEHAEARETLQQLNKY